jgi:branched-chain amino acid aminotransferase
MCPLMKNMKIWINGKFVDMKDARVSVSDRAFLYGDGVFETMRSYAGVTFKLGAHLDRLFGSLKTVLIRPPFSKKYFAEAIKKSLKINRFKSAYIRLTVTRGEGKFGIDTRPSLRPNAVIVVKELDRYPEIYYRRGISIALSRVTRQNEYSPLSNVKSLNFLNYLLARIGAKKRGFQEVVILNTKGDVAECSTSNIFAVKHGRLITPSVESGILAGITRDVVIGIAKKLKIKVEERRMVYKELAAADEIFVTSSLVEILPVTRMDRHKVGKGDVGEITKLLGISYQKEVIYDTMEHYGKGY